MAQKEQQKDRQEEKMKLLATKLRGICGILRSPPCFAKATQGSPLAFIPVASYGVFGEGE
ncbi:MAG: hypothetical protein UY98_C0037G0013 [Candidatus Kaiserbacteria bacterium GW2011_GWA2_58_9]|uniref:Uncharacterized protein n=1 Tax=Candidatus Kaiserbacteria bacterium GW2011_GWA2_58_9 TaxID=1618672 RepID=A0A0G2AWF4_9BACT|nr:MAG: hypothetical protein UY98_C0037G0013 [Candidatus Kaiserbacteria bacterium GW2011_GWA2_58_9]